MKWKTIPIPTDLFVRTVALSIPPSVLEIAIRRIKHGYYQGQLEVTRFLMPWRHTNNIVTVNVLTLAQQLLEEHGSESD